MRVPPLRPSHFVRAKSEGLMFERLIQRADNLTKRLEIVSAAYDAGKLKELQQSQQVPVAELDGWFDAAAAAVVESFGEASPQITKWRRQVETLRALDARDRDKGMFHPIKAHIANIDSLRGLLKEFEDVWYIRSLAKHTPQAPSAEMPGLGTGAANEVHPFGQQVEDSVTGEQRENDVTRRPKIQAENEPGSRSTQIILALITAASAILVGYWQFGQPKEKGPAEIGRRHFTGRVIDATDGSRLQGAKISLEAEGVPPVIYTDSEGIFSFDLPNSVKYARLVIEAEGYEDYDRRVDAELSQGIQDIRLAPIPDSGNTDAQRTEPVQELQVATAAEDQSEAVVQPRSDITPPELISKLDPHYPVVAQRLGKGATVDIKVLVDETGRVLNIQRDSEPAGFGFDEAAIDAARRALYKPAMKDGKGVAMWYTLRVTFHPS
jgi:TonB family protein